jgi:hypothetical protein
VLVLASLKSVQRDTEAFPNEVRAQQCGDTKAERELHDFSNFPAKVASLIERPQSQRSMHRQGRV